MLHNPLFPFPDSAPAFLQTDKCHENCPHPVPRICQRDFLPVIRHRKPVIEPFFHIVRFHNLPFIELYMACPWVGILISCAFPSSFSDDCCKACREKIRSCASKRKIFSQATKPLQGPPCAIIRKNNYLCCKK